MVVGAGADVLASLVDASVSVGAATGVKEIRTEIAIAASVERVWDILVDFTRYPEWNPLTPEAAGELRPGATVKLQVVAGRELRLEPVVLVVLPPRTPLARRHGPQMLFSGEHWFSIEPRTAAREVHAGEAYTGLLVPLLARRSRR